MQNATQLTAAEDAKLIMLRNIEGAFWTKVDKWLFCIKFDSHIYIHLYKLHGINSQNNHHREMSKCVTTRPVLFQVSHSSVSDLLSVCGSALL